MSNVNYKMGSEKFYIAIQPNTTTTNKGILWFNSTQNEDNAYPAELRDLAENGSSVHSNFLSLKRNLLFCNGLRPTEPSAEWTFFADTINKAGDDLNDVYEKMSADYSMFEAAAVQVIYNSEGKVAAIYHVDVGDLRAEKPDEYGRVNHWFLSKHWGEISNKKNSRATEKNKAVKIPSFNPSTGTEDGVQILYIRRYTSGSEIYSIPSYNSAINWIKLDYNLGVFENNKVEKGFFPSGILYLTGDPDDEQKAQFKNNFERKYVGAGKDKLLYVWGTNADEKPEFIRTEADKNDTLFNDLNDISAQKIATGHGGNLELAGIEGKGADLGGDANKLDVSVQKYKENVIEPMQNTMLAGLNKIMKVNELPMMEVNCEPIIEVEPTPDQSVPTEDEEEPLAVTGDKNKVGDLNLN